MCNCERYHVTTLLAGLAERPERQTIISGLRQTGKTTHVRQALNNIDTDERYLAVDDPPSVSTATNTQQFGTSRRSH